MYMSETNTSHGRESQSFTDSYFQDRLNLDLTFSPTDEIAVYWRLRGPGSYQRWGRENRRDDRGLYTQHIYGEIKQDWGTVLVGRINDDLDVYGLASLGYQPATVDIFTNTGPFDRADVLDGIRYSYAWDNGFGIMAQYGKLANNDQKGGNIADPESGVNGWSDQDYDRYQLEATYSWDGGGAALGVFYDRDATGHNKEWRGLGKPGSGYKYYAGSLDGYAVNKSESWGLNPAIMHSWGDFSIHFEGMAKWGKNHYVYDKFDGWVSPPGKIRWVGAVVATVGLDGEKVNPSVPALQKGGELMFVDRRAAKAEASQRQGPAQASAQIKKIFNIGDHRLKVGATAHFVIGCGRSRVQADHQSGQAGFNQGSACFFGQEQAIGVEHHIHQALPTAMSYNIRQFRGQERFPQPSKAHGLLSGFGSLIDQPAHRDRVEPFLRLTVTAPLFHREAHQAHWATQVAPEHHLIIQVQREARVL